MKGSMRRYICNRNMDVLLIQSSSAKPVLARGIGQLMFESIFASLSLLLRDSVEHVYRAGKNTPRPAQ